MPASLPACCVLFSQSIRSCRAGFLQLSVPVVSDHELEKMVDAYDRLFMAQGNHELQASAAGLVQIFGAGDQILQSC